MMRMAGRGSDGTAKALKVNENGLIETLDKVKGAIKTHIGLFNTVSNHVGENVTGNPTQIKRLDISKYNAVTIVLNNNTNGNLLVWGIRMYYDESGIGSVTPFGRKEYKSSVGQQWVIPAGQSLVLDEEIVSVLGSNIFSSMTVETTCAGSTGTYNVGFFGATNKKEVKEVEVKEVEVKERWRPFVARWSGNIPATSNQSIITANGDIYIDRIEWSTNDSTQTSQCRIGLFHPQGVSNGLFSLVRNDGTTTGADVKNIAEHGSYLWDIVTYNTEENKYKIKLKGPIESGHGLEVVIRNFALAERRFGILVHGKVKEGVNIRGELV